MPGNTPGPYEELYAFVSDEGDREGILGGFVLALGLPLGTTGMPYITGSPRVAAEMQRQAVKVAKATGKRIRKVTFRRAHEEPIE